MEKFNSWPTSFLFKRVIILAGRIEKIGRGKSNPYQVN